MIITPAMAQTAAQASLVYTTSPVATSTGYTTMYLDGVRMLHMYPEPWTEWFNEQLGDLWPVGVGQSGAVILGMLGRGSLINNHFGKRGLMLRGLPYLGGRVAIVDDVLATGATVRGAMQVLEEHWAVTVKKVIIAHRMQVFENPPDGLPTYTQEQLIRP